MQVLEVLAETPGEVVTRETLVARVWPGVFVSEDVLHRAIRELRRIFGDDTSNPTYVETIRKRGYRLIAPVRKAEPKTACVTCASQLQAAPLQRVHRRRVDRSRRCAWRRGLCARVAARGNRSRAGVRALRGADLRARQRNRSGPEPGRRAPRLRDAARSRRLPRIRAGRHLHHRGRRPHAAARDRASRRRSLSRVVVRCVRAGVHPHRRRHLRRDALHLRDRRERRVAACGNFEEPRVSWSADGEWLVESFAPGPDPIRGWQIARISTRTGVREELTLPTPGTLGDHSPSVSPDGTRIAFVRGINGATADLHVIPFGGGPPARVTWDNQDVIGVDWSADGRSLFYATDRAGGYTIWRVPAGGGTPAARRRRRREIEASVRGSRERPHRLRELVLRNQFVGSADRRASRSRRRSDADTSSGRAHVGSVEPFAGVLT